MPAAAECPQPTAGITYNGNTMMWHRAPMAYSRTSSAAVLGRQVDGQSDLHDQNALQEVAVRVNVSDSRQEPPAGCARSVGAALSVHLTHAVPFTNCAEGHDLAAGLGVGLDVGFGVGLEVGMRVGADVGFGDGAGIGGAVGAAIGFGDGAAVGEAVGADVAFGDGVGVGEAVGCGGC